MAHPGYRLRKTSGGNIYAPGGVMSATLRIDDYFMDFKTCWDVEVITDDPLVDCRCANSFGAEYDFPSMPVEIGMYRDNSSYLLGTDRNISTWHSGYYSPSGGDNTYQFQLALKNNGTEYGWEIYIWCLLYETFEWRRYSAYRGWLSLDDFVNDDVNVFPITSGLCTGTIVLTPISCTYPPEDAYTFSVELVDVPCVCEYQYLHEQPFIIRANGESSINYGNYWLNDRVMPGVGRVRVTMRCYPDAGAGQNKISLAITCEGPEPDIFSCTPMLEEDFDYNGATVINNTRPAPCNGGYAIVTRIIE